MAYRFSREQDKWAFDQVKVIASYEINEACNCFEFLSLNWNLKLISTGDLISRLQILFSCFISVSFCKLCFHASVSFLSGHGIFYNIQVMYEAAVVILESAFCVFLPLPGISQGLSYSKRWENTKQHHHHIEGAARFRLHYTQGRNFFENINKISRNHVVL